MKKLLSVLLAVLMLLSLVACGGTTVSEVSSEESESESKSESKVEEESKDESSEAETPVGRFDVLRTTDEPVKLQLHLSAAEPSINEEPTEENPTVFNSTRYINKAWCEKNVNASIEVIYVDTANNFSEWLTVNYTAGTGPDLIYTWGDSDYSDMGWYTYLEEIVASPNYYEPGCPVWREMFPDYLWDKGTTYIYDNRDNLIGIPLLLGPGPLTAYYYNIDLFEELGIEPVTEWQDFIDQCALIREAGYIPVAPSEWCLSPGFATWDSQFSIAPLYGAQWITDLDADGDGALSNDERIRAIWSGYFYLENNPGLVECYEKIMAKFWYVLEEGAENIDYTQPWSDGKVAMLERSLGDMPKIASDTTLTFEWGMFPPPVVQDSEYVVRIEYTEAGPYNPAPTWVPNLIDPALQDRSEYITDYLVDYLKYFTSTENLNVVVEELAGGHIGATKTCKVPAVLTNWFSQSFPLLPNSGPRPGRPNNVDSNGTTYTSYMDMLSKKMITMEEFIPMHDQLMYDDIQMYVEQEKFDTSDWGELYVPSCVAK